MLLIGQYDSPFLRRVAITLRLYGLAYEHLPWSVFGDVDRIARYNPLRRVPTLVLDDGMVLVDSGAIIEILDDMVGNQRAFLARRGAERREVLRWCALAAGVADKGLSLVYERAFREGLPMWVARCSEQISDTLDLLEVECDARSTRWLFGDTLSHADILFATMFRFLTEALPDSFAMEHRRALASHAARCETLPEFQTVYQTYRLVMPEDEA